VRLGVAAAVADGVLVPGDVDVAEGRVTAVGLAGSGSGTAVPGFVDLQVNGFGGVDFMAADRAAYTVAGEALLETGVTAYQPTLITASEAQLVAALAEVPDEELPDAAAGPRVLGAHLEGPFLSPTRLGAHPRADRRDPDAALLGRLLAAGRVSQMTLAPELPGAADLIRLLHERGVVVSFGHTDATADEAHAGFDLGVATVTHLFNAMRPLGHRDPGITGAALARADVIVQIIVDGSHLADETTLVVWRAAAGRVALVTDAIAAAATGDGRFRLGAVELDVHDGIARTNDGSLAGSTGTMIEAVRNLHALGVPLADAVAAASSVPARVLGRGDVGLLRPGARADLVVLDDALEVARVLVAGQERIAA
jgi:N-acetylglucosamine-6-phosphate deacetylase